MPEGGYWRRDGGNHPVPEGGRPDSPDSYGLARRFGWGAGSPRKLDSGLRRNDWAWGWDDGARAGMTRVMPV